MNAMQLTPERKETLRQYWQEKSLSELMDFIVAHYHARAARLVSQIVAEIDTLAREASCTPKDLSTALQHLRTMLTDDLAQHTREEEELLFLSPTEIQRRSDNGTEERFFKANPVECGVAPQTWAAEVEYMRRSAIRF